MHRRTRTYIAGAWTESSKAITKLQEWNEGKMWALHFIDAHELTQSRDTSLSCTIKDSLRERMNASHTFILVVGNETASLRKGGCQYCCKYHHYGWSDWCDSGKNPDHRSFIEYECELAAEAYDKEEMRVIVLYDALSVDRKKCLDALAYKGKHVPMKYRDSSNGKVYWNYQEIKKAIMG